MGRKTLKVDDLKQYVNDFLFHSANEVKEAREAMCVMLEEMLRKTENYNGFQYISRVEMQKSNRGSSFGIESETDGNKFVGTDRTRRRYF